MADRDALIRENDSLTIRLQQAFVHDCFELGLNPLRGFQSNCEIAIVVNAFEMGSGEDFDFTPNGVKKGRVVFYSGDVQPGQPLNFNNMPVYGPITYKGGPIGLDIFIIEIDSGSKQAKALLKAVASAGAIAYPPASPVLQLLDSLGGALLSSGSDDIEFRYSLVLDPSGDRPLPYARLEAANYVLVREDDRMATTPWQVLRLDENTGRLFVSSENKIFQPYKANTYLTFQVNRNLSSVEVDLSQNTFGQFRTALEAEDERRAQDLAPLTAALQGVALERSRIRRFDSARARLGDIKAGQAAGGPAGKQVARAAALDIITAVKTAKADNQKTPPEGALSDERIDYLLKSLRDMTSSTALGDLQLFDAASLAAGGPSPQQIERMLDLIAP